MPPTLFFLNNSLTKKIPKISKFNINSVTFSLESMSLVLPGVTLEGLGGALLHREALDSSMKGGRLWGYCHLSAGTCQGKDSYTQGKLKQDRQGG